MESAKTAAPNENVLMIPTKTYVVGVRLEFKKHLNFKFFKISFFKFINRNFCRNHFLGISLFFKMGH